MDTRRMVLDGIEHVLVAIIAVAWVIISVWIFVESVCIKLKELFCGR